MLPRSHPTERIIKLTSVIIIITTTIIISIIKIIGKTNLEKIETIIIIKMVPHLLLEKKIHIFYNMMSSRNFQMNKRRYKLERQENCLTIIMLH